MDLTVVIRCCDDSRVFDCIGSIDEEVEVIVSLCENSKLQSELNSIGINYVLVPRGNLSITSNKGFSEASFEKVIITDSDTKFEEGCIEKIYQSLDDYKVAKAGIKFQRNDGNLFSKIVAEARDFVNSLPLVFTPGIGVRKDLVKDIGGFLFNESVPFAVDADLDYRIKISEVEVGWLMDEALIYHSSEEIRHDLRAAYRIGKGCRTSFESLKSYNEYSQIDWNDLKAVKKHHLTELIREKGGLVLVYQFLWDFSFWSGYIRQMLNH